MATTRSSSTSSANTRIREYATSTLVYMGMLWTALWLAFEWGGSLLIGRPVHEILIGWHIVRGSCGRTCCPPICCHHSSSG